MLEKRKIFQEVNQRAETSCLPSAALEVTTLAKSLNQRWRELCSRFLPIAATDRKWRYSRKSVQTDLEQGWKLHLSANVLTACEVLQRVAPYLQSRGALFKAPVSLDELSRINCGLYYGYSQVGKFLTVYPRTDEEAVRLARRLHHLTIGLAAPAVPFDQEFCEGSCVYYRYGAFKAMELENPDGTLLPALRHPDGHLIPDLREAETAKPDWVCDPFSRGRQPFKPALVETPLKTTFRAFRALAQRGKGGVYQAIDLSVHPPRLCLLKEGRSGGEINWDGRDGVWRVQNEERVLRALDQAGVKVPRIYSSFAAEGNYYLVTEFIEGDNLQSCLNKRRRRVSIPQALRCGWQLALLISQIHAAGWVWRDCKPANLMVMRNGEFRPLDFEGACPIDQPDSWLWGTPHFSPPESAAPTSVQASVGEDLYAIGAIIYYLLTGTLLNPAKPVPIVELRRNTPAFVCELIAELLTPDSPRCLNAQTTAERFRAALSVFQSAGVATASQVR